MPSSSTSGWPSETRRLKIGFSQIERPTPWPDNRDVEDPSERYAENLLMMAGVSDLVLDLGGA